MRVVTLGLIGAVMMSAGFAGQTLTRGRAAGAANPVETEVRRDEGVRVVKALVHIG